MLETFVGLRHWERRWVERTKKRKQFSETCLRFTVLPEILRLKYRRIGSKKKKKTDLDAKNSRKDQADLYPKSQIKKCLKLGDAHNCEQGRQSFETELFDKSSLRLLTSKKEGERTQKNKLKLFWGLSVKSLSGKALATSLSSKNFERFETRKFEKKKTKKHLKNEVRLFRLTS